MEKLGIEFMLALGLYGFGFRHPGGVMPELRLGIIRLRVALPRLEDVLERHSRRRRADNDNRKPPADGP